MFIKSVENCRQSSVVRHCCTLVMLILLCFR